MLEIPLKQKNENRCVTMENEGRNKDGKGFKRIEWTIETNETYTMHYAERKKQQKNNKKT